MAIKKPIPITFNLDSRQSVQSVCTVIHIDDNNTETLDLSLMQGGEHIAVSPNSTVTARFVRVKDKILISDNVPCAVQENGNILIPIDNAAAHMLVGEIKIEVNIVDENDILTMQFPLVIKVNNTILADAEISPESEGTIPELLEEAREAAESATHAAEAATEAIGTKQDKLTAGENITIENNVISAEGGGVTSYNDLTDKPKLYLRVGGSSPSIEPTEVDISNVFRFLRNEIYLTRSENGYAVNFNIPFNGLAENKEYFHSQTEWNKYNFNSLSTRQKNGIWDLNVQKCLNTPQFIIDCFVGIYNLNFFIMHFLTDYYVIRVVAGEDVNNDLRIFSQYLTTNPTTGAVTSQTDWVELTGGGSQIVSGVVNANGTITFTDSEDNSFTTSGESVIGADGYSPSATVQQTASGATITVTDKAGTTTANISNGQNGQDYVLTAQDKSDIADIVLNELPTTEGVLYGNQSN